MGGGVFPVSITNSLREMEELGNYRQNVAPASLAPCLQPPAGAQLVGLCWTSHMVQKGILNRGGGANTCLVVGCG